MIRERGLIMVSRLLILLKSRKVCGASPATIGRYMQRAKGREQHSHCCTQKFLFSNCSSIALNRKYL